MLRPNTMFVSAVQARAMIDDVGMDNVTIHLDTYHMNIEENSMEAAIKDAEDKLGWEPSQHLFAVQPTACVCLRDVPRSQGELPLQALVCLRAAQALHMSMQHTDPL